MVASPREDPDLLEFFEKFKERCGWAFKRVTGGTIPTLPQPMLERLEKMRARLGDIDHADCPSNVSLDVRKAIHQLHNMKELVRYAYNSKGVSGDTLKGPGENTAYGNSHIFRYNRKCTALNK